MRRANQRFDAFLRERGYSPAGGEVPEGAGWAGWRNRTDRVFEALFPAPPAERCESRAALTRYSFFSSTFDRRPLASYFARRAGGRSSGVPSTKPPFAWK